MTTCLANLSPLADTTTNVLQAFVTVGLAGIVYLLVTTVFGQSGEIQLSPQREAALLTGHDDRSTVFEKARAWQPACRTER